jgi:hypothetical protein
MTSDNTSFIISAKKDLGRSKEKVESFSNIIYSLLSKEALVIKGSELFSPDDLEELKQL